MDELDTLLKSAKRSVFRFEGLQDYSAEDGDKTVRMFTDTGKLYHHPKDSPWWQEMKRKNDVGVKTCRVRKTVEPFTPYTKMELAYLQEAARFSGDEVRIINENAFKRIVEDRPDFWLFDNRVAFVMSYGPEGKFIGGETISDGHVTDFANIRRKLVEHSRPL